MIFVDLIEKRKEDHHDGEVEKKGKKER